MSDGTQFHERHKLNLKSHVIRTLDYPSNIALSGLSIYPGMASCSSMNFLHSIETLLGRLLSLLRVVGVVDGGLQTSSDVVRVLVSIGPRG